MREGPDLPHFALRRGPWRAVVHDPRPDPFALGARYVHGGYVHALWRGERCLTTCAILPWRARHGGGLPETFETDFAAAHTAIGDTYIRIGAGRLIRDHSSPRSVSVRLDLPLAWELVGRGEDWLTMRCRDEILGGGDPFAYELERTVRLHDDGLESLNTLLLDSPWNHPMSWYPHPFWAHDGTAQTRYRLPESAALVGWLSRDENGLVHVDPGGRKDGASGQARGVWGHRGNIDCHLSPSRGGGIMRLELDKPWDHVVVWASSNAASAEPQLARIWPRHERAGWSLRYRWIG